MLQTIGDFAAERLTESGEEASIQSRHAAYFLAYAERIGPIPLLGSAQSSLDALEMDHANLRGALALFDETGDLASFARLACAIGWFWFVRGFISDARASLTRVWDHRDAVSDSVVVRTAVVLSPILLAQGDLERAEAIVVDGLHRARATHNTREAVQALLVLGVVACARSDFDQAVVHLTESMEIARTLADWKISRALSSAALANLSVAARGQGRLELAAAYQVEALAGHRAVGAIRGEMNSIADGGDIALEREDYAGAGEAFRASLAIAWRLGEVRTIVWTLQGLACVAVNAGEFSAAANRFGAAERLGETAGLFNTWLAIDRAIHERAITEATAAIGPDTWVNHWQEGRAMAIETAVASALEPPAPGGGAQGAVATSIVLTPRERQILPLIVAGKTDREIADALTIGRRTVESHVARLLAKLGVATRTAAASAAIAAGLIRSGSGAGRGEEP
jgi:non-specific serine/threonine protein kinase